MNIDETRRRLSTRLGYRFADPELLEQALSHRSWCAEHGGLPSNERLEFLGDAVIGLVVAEHGYRRFPEMPEGMLAKVRAAVVNSRVLAEIGSELDVGSVLKLGKGEDQSGGRAKQSILADTVEALVGAAYLEAGWKESEELVLRLLHDRIVRAASEPGDFDHKSLLQERAIRRGHNAPRYVVTGTGPDHERHYTADVYVDGERRGTGEGPSKKDAEQAAAKSAWETQEEGDIGA